MAEKTGRGVSAAQGAATGAQVGGVLGLGPVGAGIGAGVGALGGAIFGGSELQALEEKELEELRRRQELGALGLTDEEQAVLRQQIVGPAAQLATESRQRQAQLTATQDLGAGQAAKANIEQVAQDQKLMQDAADKVMLADMKHRLNEEARISQLTGEVSAQQKADQEAAFASIAATAGVFGDIRKAEELQTLDEERLRERLAQEAAATSVGIAMRGQSMPAATSMFTSIWG